MTAPQDTHQDNHHDNEHERADALLDGYLMGTLSPWDAAWIERHVHTCPRCQEEIAPLMAAVQALPFGAPEPDVPMPGALWDRIERAVSDTKPAEPDFIPLSSGPLPRSSHEGPRRLTAREWLAIAAVALVSLLGGTLLGQALPPFLGGDDAEQGQVIAVQFTDPNVTASGELRYLPEEQVFVLEITGLPELPEGQVYQAWLIDGSAPVPVGVVDPETGELATLGNRDAYQTFALTVEQGPLGNPAPTSDPIMIAPL